MRKRIKARIKLPKAVSSDFAEKVYSRGRRLCQFVLNDDIAGVVHTVCNVRYKGKVYFIERFKTKAGKSEIYECFVVN